ncbi:MAG: hypothetical protein WB711_06340 [Terriglobales bacterium]
MRFQRTLRRSVAVVAFALLASAAGMAQQYQILRADYGYGNQRVDVTQRLRDLARSNRTFRMGNSTFGVDPAPGKVKSLRVFTRGSNGRDRTFEYPEGSVVDGSMFSGWSGGNWGSKGGEYVILNAQYGVASRHVDLTQRLRQLAAQNSFFRMGNSTFGVDPAPGQVKVLRIYARGPDGRSHMFEYPEGSIVDGSRFSGWGNGNWGSGNWNGGWNPSPVPSPVPPPAPRPPLRVPPGGNTGQLNILSAAYGSGNRTRDVTARLQSTVRNGRLNTMVNNTTMGSDPAPGAPKTLRVSYSVGRAAAQQVIVQEGRQLNIP